MPTVEEYLAKFDPIARRVSGSHSALAGLTGAKGTISRMQSYLKNYAANLTLVNDELVKESNKIINSVTNLSNDDRKKLAEKLRARGMEAAKEWMRKNKNT